MVRIKTWLEEVKNFFYDSYSGWKRKRVVIVVSGFATLLTLVITLAVVFQSGTLPDLFGNDTQGGQPTIADILPGKVQGYDPDSPYTPNIRNQVPREPSKEWVWGDERRYGNPLVGDIVSVEGTVPDEGSVNTPSVEGDANPSNIDTVDSYNPYGVWETKVETRSVIQRTLDKLQNNYLMRMHAGADENWARFSADVSQILMDAPFIGEQVRKYMSVDTVGVWEQLEVVYGELYVAVYSCESADDLLAVAEGEVRQNAMALTAQFVEALGREAVN